MDKKKIIGLFFGGRSPEHEVSIITALQAYKNLDLQKYQVIPIYVSKSGHFYTNNKFLDIKNYKNLNSLLLSSKQIVLANKNGRSGFLMQGFFQKFHPLDLALPLFHGSFGEDGCIQGLFETYSLPYSGFGVLGSAIAMDKVLSKCVFLQLGLPFAKYTWIKREDWIDNPKKCLKDIQSVIKFPLFIKPATAGSSIGVGGAKNEDELSFAIEVASTYAEKIIVEEAFENVIEVNCSVLGYEKTEVSVCEQPISSSEILTFSDKYQKGGSKNAKGAGGMESLSRIIPAPINEKLTKEIQLASKWIFEMLDGCGVARIDFFVDVKNEKFYVNEINSPPGSLAFYLWEKSGLKYKDLLNKIIEFGLKRFENQKKTQYTFNSGLLAQMAEAASK